MVALNSTEVSFGQLPKKHLDRMVGYSSTKNIFDQKVTFESPEESLWTNCLPFSSINVGKNGCLSSSEDKLREKITLR